MDEYKSSLEYITVGRVLFQNICGQSYCFWLKWVGYLAVTGLNLLAQISDRISPGSVLNCVHCHMLSLLVSWHQVLNTTRTY